MKSLAKLMVGIAIIGLFLTASSASAPVSAAQSASGTLRFIEFYSPL